MPLNIVRQDTTKMTTDAIVAAKGQDIASYSWVGSAIEIEVTETLSKCYTTVIALFVLRIIHRTEAE